MDLEIAYREKFSGLVVDNSSKVTILGERERRRLKMFFSLGVKMEGLIWAGETVGAPIWRKNSSDFWVREAFCLVRVDFMVRVVTTEGSISLTILARGE